MWKDPEVKMVLMSQGGTSANQLLDRLDYEMIKENPKIFAGISDGTSLLNAIYAKTGLVTYHGPDLLWAFGRKMTEPFRENLIKTFFGGEVGQLAPNPKWEHQGDPTIKHQGWTCLRQGEAKKILVGGHSRTFINTIFAGYCPDLNDKILFLEGTETVARMDSQLTSLELHGVFRHINQLILGWFDESEMENREQNRPISEIVLEATRNYGFPILEIGELGHNVENYVFPIGCNAAINSGSKYLAIEENTVL